LQRNKHCWDWWNLSALSDNEEVFERPDSPPIIPNSGDVPCNGTPSNDRVKKVHLRKTFVRAKSAEPESNLCRKKSTSLPEVHKGQVGES